MAHRICLRSGENPREWLEKTTDEDLHRWEAFYEVEPFGFEAERNAMLCELLDRLASMIAASSGVRYTPGNRSDFMPENWVRTQKPKETTDKMAAIEVQVASMFPTADSR